MLADFGSIEAVRSRVQPLRVERWAFVFIMLVSEGLTHLAGSQDSDSGSLLAQAIWGVAYILAIAGIYAERERAMPLIRKSAPLLLIVGIALLSTLWSYDPAITLRRAIGLFGTMAIAFYVVSRFSLEEFLETLTLTIKAIAVISLFLIIFVPELGVMQDRYVGSWQGLTLDKNRLGGVMAMGAATMWLLAYAKPSDRTLGQALWGIVLLVLLGGSVSATAIAALFFVVGCIYALFRLRNKRIGFAVAALCIVGGAAALLASVIGFGAGDILALFGRDSTLTGRTDIWQYASQYISERPVLGWGYEVFWDPQGPVKRYLLKDLGWEPASAHNGYLEVALNFGFVGLALFLAFLIETVRRTFAFFHKSVDRLAAWPLLATILLTITNLADPTFVYYNELRWLVLMVAFLYATQAFKARGTIEPVAGQEHGLDYQYWLGHEHQDELELEREQEPQLIYTSGILF